MFDGLRLILYIGIFAMVVAMACLGCVGIANGSSRNMSLALGATLGTLLLLCVQMLFELQPAKSVAVIKTEFTTDRAKSKIEQSRYPTANGYQFSNEVDANKFLLGTNPKAFEGDGETLWKDMSLFSLVLYLWIEQHDWQISRDSFESSEMGTFERFKFLSPPDDPSQCTKVALSELQAKLRGAHNLFAEYKPLPFEFMCLPPGARLLIEPGLIVIETPFYEVRFVIEDLWLAKTSWRPGNSSDLPLLANGEPRFQTRTGVVRVTVTSAWIRAQSREMPKYQAWANDVVERARRWFSTDIKGNMFLGGQFDDPPSKSP